MAKAERLNLEATEPLCGSGALLEGGVAVVFDVMYEQHMCRAFAIRFNGDALAYLNRCGHVSMEMDYVAGHFFDASGQWLICATHGARYDPHSGECRGGPCQRALIKIELSEYSEEVRWHTCSPLKPTCT